MSGVGWGVFCVALCVLLGSCGTGSPPIDLTELQAQSEAERSMARETRVRINRIRRQNGKVGLQEDSELSKLALLHAQRMARGVTEFGHYSFNYRFTYAMNLLGYTHLGENVGYYTGAQPVEWIVGGWMESKGHRGQILGDATYCGVGAARSADGKTFLVMLYALPKPKRGVGGPKILRDAYGAPL